MYSRTDLFINCLIDKFWSYITFVVIDSGPPSNLMLTQVNGRRIQTSWTAPSNPVVDYRVFVDDTNVNGNGSIVASGTTTYTTTSQFSAVTTVTIRVRATATYWSEVAMESITVLGKCCFFYIHTCTNILHISYIMITESVHFGYHFNDTNTYFKPFRTHYSNQCVRLVVTVY